MAADSTGLLQGVLHKRRSLITKGIAALLVLMLILFILQWFVITQLFSFAAELMKSELIQQAPDGVDRAAIQTTFDRVERTLRDMPLSYLQGKVRLKKVKIAADYALKANEDGVWTSEEINTLLEMTNAAVGFKGKEK